MVYFKLNWFDICQHLRFYLVHLIVDIKAAYLEIGL